MDELGIYLEKPYQWIGSRKHKGKNYVLGLVDEYLARWMLESELEFSMTRCGKASSQR
jgi:hypothetical protein